MSEQAGMTSLYIKISGRVQGVFFRMHTRDQAIKLRLGGTVRNCQDGTVEVYVSGVTSSLNEFIDWCRKGPPAAKVDKIDIHQIPLKNFEDFVILRE
jgi:acylphosphatase